MVQTTVLSGITMIAVLLVAAALHAQDVHQDLATPPPPPPPVASAEEIHPLLIGMKIPDVTVNATDGSPFRLSEAIEKKPTVLIFYRGGWCPYCNVHLGQLQSAEPELLKLGYQIFAISADRPEKLRESMEKKHFNYTLLSDSSMACARSFGLAFRVDENMVEKYKSYNMDLEEASGLKHHLLPVPAVFIIGTDGIIKFEYVNPNYKVRIDPNVLSAAARAVLK
ncbi:MAG: AhpC/TSA family protein [Ignavibacteriae bacterium]|nr:AhpC/TSA family protein [Ignavibacteriota bacterium]